MNVNPYQSPEMSTEDGHVVAARRWVGWLAMRYSRRLRRLESSRDAMIACLLGMILYPMCILTLPLAIYGLIVLRRRDVQAVFQEQAER